MCIENNDDAIRFDSCVHDRRPHSCLLSVIPPLLSVPKYFFFFFAHASKCCLACMLK